MADAAAPPPDFDKLAADPSLDAYRDPASGAVRFYPKTTDQTVIQGRHTRGLIPATPEDVQNRSAYLKSTTTLGQLKAAGKLGANVATFGLAGYTSPEDLQQIKNFRAESPTLATATEGAAALGPGAAVGALTGGLGPAVGLGANAVRAAALAADTLAQTSSTEIEHAREEARDIEPANILMGLPLAFGMSAAARLARGGLGLLASAGTEDLTAAASAERNALGQGLRETAERRQAPARGPKAAGAQAAKDAVERPLERPEVEHYAEQRDQYHAQANQLGADAVEDLVGGYTPAADEVMSIRNKFGDSVGKMADADEASIAVEVENHSSALQDLADKLDARGAKAAGSEVREYAAKLEDVWQSGEHQGASDVHVEGTADVLDGAKRYLDRLQSKYGQAAYKATDPTQQAASEISKVLEPMRDSLEQKDTWGGWFAERQHSENKRFWTGPEGLIQTGAVWQHELLERLPGAAGRVRRGLEEVPAFRVRGDAVQHLLGLTQRRFDEVVGAANIWREKAQQMALEKVERGAASTDHTPIVRMNTALGEMQTFIDEAKFIRRAEYQAKPLIAKAEARTAAKGVGEVAFDVAEKLPGTKHALHLADAMSEATTGKSLREHLFETPLGNSEPRYTRSEAQQLIQGRQQARLSVGRPPVPRGTPPTPGAASAPPGSTVPIGKIGAALGVVGAGGALLGSGNAQAAEPPETTALAQLSENAKAIRQRAAYGLVAPDSRAPSLPGVTVRFKGDAPTLQAAFLNHADELQQAVQNPKAWMQSMATAYGNLHEAHSDLYNTIVQRTMVGVQYMLANMPPSVAISMTRPGGLPPDAIAIAQWASLWSGAFAPGDVVHDIGTGDATPSQVRALREVHPDVYAKTRIDVLRALGESSEIPFETKRRLDVLFELDGAAGPGFSSRFANLLAEANAQNKQSVGSPSSQSLAVPESPTKVFRQGPTYAGR